MGGVTLNARGFGEVAERLHGSYEVEGFVHTHARVGQGLMLCLLLRQRARTFADVIVIPIIQPTRGREILVFASLRSPARQPSPRKTTLFGKFVAKKTMLFFGFGDTVMLHVGERIFGQGLLEDSPEVGEPYALCRFLQIFL